MLLTTSRKPSTRSRTLCKHLGRYLNCDYVNRGKMSFEEIFDFHPDVPVLLIGEYHGNPGSFEIFDSSGNYLLSIYMDVAYSGDIKSLNRKKGAPVVMGRGNIAETIAKTLSFEHAEQNSDESCGLRCIVIGKDTIDLMDSGKLLFSFRIKSYKIFGKGGRCEGYS
ncbi:MAG: rRNA maturation protein [Methanohalobium sp.]|uniref:rRNA maturation protein n=1 Tax=Methanohalobium sp. TaxID=2837493 RepID=UPI00397C1247